MSRTLLDMVQGILSDLSGDKVNTHDATEQSLTVANIVKNTYFELVDKLELPASRTLFSLDSEADTDRPTAMRVPTTIEHVEWLKYDTRSESGDPIRFETIQRYDPETFLDQIMLRSSDSSEISTVAEPTLGSGVTLLIRNDTWPSYWTSFDDRIVIFDAYKSDLESTLQSSKSMGYGSKTRTWLMEDTFVPDLPNDLFTLLYADAKSTASLDLTKQVNPKAEKQAHGHLARARRGRIKQDGGQHGWGRRSPGSVGRGPLYDRNDE